jgi:hypothetical protein
MIRTGLSILCFAMMCILFSHIPAQAQETLSIQVKKGELRATPSFLGKIVARVAYGDRVDVTEKRGAWRKVSPRGGNLQGWIHASALTAKRVLLRAGQAGVRTGATRDELALAGKGFSEEVEASYRKENGKLDYTWINRMETFEVTPDQMRNFLVQGGVSLPREGDRP